MPSPCTSKRRSPTRRPRLPLLLLLLLLLAAASLLLALALLDAAAGALLRRANALGRRCSPDQLTGYGDGSTGGRRPRIAMVSFSVEEEEEEATASRRRWRGRRSFRGVAEAAGGNKREYAARMGYGYVVARDLVDRSRPPNWSKILAVRSQLPSYDWVFWNDADTVVTNMKMSLENILIAAIGHDDLQSSPDLVVTEDFNGVNSGVFFLRRSEWSEMFLDRWWNQTSFIRFGSTKSGDNAAMKRLVDDLPEEELRAHVRVSPMQCLFNSYPWAPSWKSLYRLLTSPRTTWKGVYSDGDFMVHLAGLDEKKKWVAKVIEELRSIQ